jgi:hypothetical protein
MPGSGRELPCVCKCACQLGQVCRGRRCLACQGEVGCPPCQPLEADEEVGAEVGGGFEGREGGARGKGSAGQERNVVARDVHAQEGGKGDEEDSMGAPCQGGSHKDNLGGGVEEGEEQRPSACGRGGRGVKWEEEDVAGLPRCHCSSRQQRMR